MTILLPDHIFDRTEVTEAEFKLDLALLMYEKGMLTSGKAAEFAGVSQFEFGRAMATRGLSISYKEEDLDHDLRQLKEQYGTSW